MTQTDQISLIASLRAAVGGEVFADPVRRGMYATDASHYQMMPRCVVVPRDEADVVATMDGYFGYEHSEVSMAIGNQCLFPAARDARAHDAVVCARV